MDTRKYDVSVDVTGMNCPLPILRAKKTLAQMETGQVLQVLATDKNAPEDFAAFCQQTGHELINLFFRDDGVYEIVLKHR